MSSEADEAVVSSKELAFGAAKLTESVVVTNNGPNVLTFKLKTTNMSLSVKPRIGFIEPRSSESIQFKIKDELPLSPEFIQKVKTTIFLIELRGLTEKEIKARQADASTQANELGVPAQGKGDFVNWLWSKEYKASQKFTVREISLRCSYSDDAGYTTPRRALRGETQGTTDQSLTVQVERAQSLNTKLKTELNALEQKREELYSKNKAHQAAAEELRSKAEKAGITIPGWLFVILWLLFFYIGLVLDRYYPTP